MSEPEEPDWAAVRADYEAGGRSVAEVARAHGISRDQLNRQRVREDWILRRPGTGRMRRRNILARMVGLIEAQITQLERKLIEDPMNTSEIRMLESMTKALDRITALSEAENKVARKRVKTDPELEAIRERLSQRISELDVEG
ncbi:hypothetical protein [Pelagibacterium lacus]|uniref:Uncharacterized protein n=1 Tax=Pelagibacterium lacus TaxID=2282655 RepID=A0A369W923_9HYPH|nr:hypothetical protein [Pelagibacterium lacus]RDE10469.1 hypothetical protein DVH29_00515 [Pelagibacterium lacus]